MWTTVIHMYYAVKSAEIRNTLADVPKQTRPQMIVRSFRIPEAVWASFVARCEREGLNPTEVIRDLATDWADEES